MGDRANIKVITYEYEPAVYFYTHWNAKEVPETVQKALAKRWRWTDGAYLARIVYDTLVGEDFGSETGYGISSHIGDNGHPIFVIDVPKQQVYLRTEGESIRDDNRVRDQVVAIIAEGEHSDCPRCTKARALLAKERLIDGGELPSYHSKRISKAYRKGWSFEDFVSLDLKKLVKDY